MQAMESFRRVCRAASAAAPRWRVIVSIAACGIMLGADARGAAEAQAEKRAGGSDMQPAIQLAPFVVNGERLAISVLARTKADRRYGEKFAEDVIEVVCATVEKSPGAGLVIVGEEGEPHPVFVFRKFVELAQANQLDPAVATRAREATEMIRNWELRLNLDDAAKDGLPVEAFVNALPLPLEGVASQLYQLAWAEGFDEKRVELKLRSLTSADLAGDQLSRFDWVFYLPPREAFGEAMKAVVPTVLKKEKVGLFKRAAIRSAMVAFAPAIKKAVEGARKGMLFMTVLRARSGYSDDDVMQLTRVYVRVLMPDFKFNEGKTHARAIEAIEAQKIANAEYAKDPFVSPPRLESFEAVAYAKFVGEYAEQRETTHRFAQDGNGFTWQYLDRKPQPFFPVTERRFVSENGTMTIEFLVDANGSVSGVEERWVRRRKTVPRQTLAPTEIAHEETRGKRRR